MVETPPEGWGEYRKLILSELERISGDLKDLNTRLDLFRQDEISKIKIDIAMLKVKAGAWGVLGGVAVTLASVLVGLLGR